jgi:hypothetical protein
MGSLVLFARRLARFDTLRVKTRPYTLLACVTKRIESLPWNA